MENEKIEKNANNIYRMFCEVLEEFELNFGQNEEKRLIHLEIEADDLTTEYVIKVDAEREVVKVLALLPVTFKEDRRVDGMIATAEANYSLIDGSFDFTYEKGKVLFRIGMSFSDSILSKEVIKYMVLCAASMVDRHVMDFFMLAKGAITVEDFIAKM